jgi:hypothetical protein
MTPTNKNNFKRTIRICYPAGTGTLVIRTDLDWGRDVNPVAVSSDGNTATFEIEAQQRFLHFKPCLIKNGSLHWAVGPDNLALGNRRNESGSAGYAGNRRSSHCRRLFE